MKLAQSIQLSPVVELPPSSFSKQEHKYPEVSGRECPDGWERYWLNSLGDSGIFDLQAIRPGSWHVATADLIQSRSLTTVLRATFGGYGDREQLAGEHFNGGCVLLDGTGELISEPQCCCDLNVIDDWRNAAAYRGLDWEMLWVGHPWHYVRYSSPFIHLSHQTENTPSNATWAISPAELESAIAAAAAEISRFIEAALPILDGLGFKPGQEEELDDD